MGGGWLSLWVDPEVAAGGNGVLPIGTRLGEDAAGTSGRVTLPQGQYPSHARGLVGVWSLQSSPFHNRTDGLTSRDEDRNIPGFSTCVLALLGPKLSLA